MAKLPQPPARLPSLESEHLIRLAPPTVLWRVYFAAGRYWVNWDDFRFFGPTDARFDHHEEPSRFQDRGIMYCSNHPVACLAEVFQRTRTIHRSRNAPFLAAFSSAQESNLLDLRGVWPTRAGASQAISTGPRKRARRWAKAIYENYDVDGLIYTPSMYGEADAFAIFERAAGPTGRRLPGTLLLNRPLVDPYILSPLLVAARTIGYRLI